MNPDQKKILDVAVPIIAKYVMDVNNAFNAFLQIDDDENESANDNSIAISSATHFIKNEPITQEYYVERVVANYSRIEFQQAFRMPRDAFEFLLSKLSNNSEFNEMGRPQTNFTKQLLAVIWLLATTDSYRSVGEKFGYSKSMLSLFFCRIVRCLNKISCEIIKWPSAAEITKKINGFQRKSPFINVIGVVDGTYVPICPPADQAIWYRNRNKFHSITLQAICDSDMRFLDCSAGYPSSVHDCRIFKNSLLYQKASANPEIYFPNSSVILGDKAYPLLKWCITPYMDRGKLTTKQKQFNTRHSGTRNVVERSFALLFGRFCRLQQLDMHCGEWYAPTILACCVLHNICLKHDDDFVEVYMQNGSHQARQSNSDSFQNVDEEEGELQGELIRQEMLNMIN